MQRLRQWLGVAPRKIYYISDDANWAFHWVSHYVTHYLQERGVPIQQVLDVPQVRHQIVHFGDRYAYLNAPQRVDPSNRVIVTWFHGDPVSPEFGDLFATLRDHMAHVAFITTSCQISQRQLLAAGVPSQKLVLIPIGVDTTKFMPAPSPQTRQAMRRHLNIPPDALCVGSFQKDGSGWGEGFEPKLIKGPDVFLQVLERVWQREKRLFVLLTGPARGYVKRGLERLGIPYAHDYLDDYHDLPPYYHALDAYLITSRVEGGPKGLMESWGSGVAVVSTAMGMSADLIRHEENGMLAAVDDVAGLSAHLGRVLADATLRERLTTRALVDVKAYEWRVIADSYYRGLYAPLLNER